MFITTENFLVAMLSTDDLSQIRNELKSGYNILRLGNFHVFLKWSIRRLKNGSIHIVKPHKIHNVLSWQNLHVCNPKPTPYLVVSSSQFSTTLKCLCRERSVRSAKSFERYGDSHTLSEQISSLPSFISLQPCTVRLTSDGASCGTSLNIPGEEKPVKFYKNGFCSKNCPAKQTSGLQAQSVATRCRTSSIPSQPARFFGSSLNRTAWPCRLAKPSMFPYFAPRSRLSGYNEYVLTSDTP